MMSKPSMAYISRISFLTDMTRKGAPEIPLAFMLEGAWVERARWLGLIGRTKLTSSERDAINFATWPGLEKPFVLLERLFDQGWEAQWGKAGAAVQGAWGTSALSVRVEDASHIIAGLAVETDVAWIKTTDMLNARLSTLGEGLRPLPPTCRPFEKRKIPPQPAPTARRTQEDFAMVA